MVEVLIAGVLLASAISAVSRISVAALSNSARSSERSKIEAAINDNIQMLQKEDSYFTYEWIEEYEDIQAACAKPEEALNSRLQTIVEKPRVSGIERTFDATSTPGILKVIYEFVGPETSIGQEQRLIEMHPNFAAKCFSTTP